MPNRYLVDSVENRVKVAHVIRRLRPSVIICPAPVGLHPDHKAVSAIADAARFYAKLTKTAPDGSVWPGEPWWTPRQYYYYLGGAEEGLDPTFVVDISSEYKRKMELLACYASQWQVDMDLLAAGSHWGRLIGAKWGEAFHCRGPVGVEDLMLLAERRGMPRQTDGSPPSRG